MVENNEVSIPQAVWIACNIVLKAIIIAVFKFQYRKRYGLHAMFNGLDMEFGAISFQYRKRYGLHAICIPERGR